MSMDKFWKVTKFTVAQQVKGKAFKISTTIILLAVLILTSLVNIIPAINSDNESESSGETQGTESQVNIDTVYYSDESDLGIKVDLALKEAFPNMVLKEIDKPKEEFIEELKESKEKEVLLNINKDESGYLVVVTTPADSEEVSDEDAHGLASIVASCLETNRLINSGVSSEKIESLSMPINSMVQEAGDAEKTFEDILLQMVFPMVACMLLFYIIYFYGYWVASSIVAEKTSRVMELLLTSTKSMELVVGKCVGMGFLAIVQFATIILTSFLGFEGGEFIAINLLKSSGSTFDVGAILSKIPLSKALLIIVFFILGYVLYAIFNALVGATVSKLEDLNTAIMPVSFLSIISFYLAYMGIMTEGSTVAKIATYVPFSAPFYIPATILSDTVSLGQMGIALLILIGTIVLFTMFTARVYSVVILHTGNRLKMKDLFKIYSREK